MKDLLIIGCGGHAKSIIDLIKKEEWNLLGCIGKKEDLGKKLFNYNVIGTDEDLIFFSKKCRFAFIAIGQIKSSRKRKSISEKMYNLNFQFPILSSKNAIISPNSYIGEGTSVGHGAIINSGSKVGKHCIINTMALVEHDTEIKDFCHISTGAIVNGGVSIGKNSFVGSGAIIREGLSIPPNTIISAGKRIMSWPPMEK